MAQSGLLASGCNSDDGGDVLMDAYSSFLIKKKITDTGTGITKKVSLNSTLYPFQAAITEWALKRGRAAIWADCGLGKTFMQLEWARVVSEETKRPVLILAPLAVSQQTIREAAKLGMEIKYCRNQDQVIGGVTVSNYEMLEHFSAPEFSGVVLDESSILKNYAGKFRNLIIDTFQKTPYRLACTATPSPNDYMELGNHSEFVGAMTRPEMLATFFVHDGGETSAWRLKRHAQNDFWKWITSWAVMIRKPSDIGFDDTGYDLPELKFHQHILDDDKPTPGFLISMPAVSLEEQRRVKRDSIGERTSMSVAIADKVKGPVLIWCELNDESKAISKALNCPEITGSDSPEEKESALMDFVDKKERVIVTKPSIAGMGLNLQHCADMIFCNLTHSYEDLYQAVRRCWRFGQKRVVNVHQIMMRSEMAILENMQRKQCEADKMAEKMEGHMRASMAANIGHTIRTREEVNTIGKVKLPEFLKGAA